MENTNQTAGMRLRLIRREIGMSAAELGRRAGLLLPKGRALSESAVRNHENGSNGIPVDVAQAYATILRTSAPWILFGDLDGPTGVEWVVELGDYYNGWFDIDKNRPSNTAVHISTLPPNTLLLGAKIVGRQLEGHGAGTILVFAPGLIMGIRAADTVLMRRTMDGRLQATVGEIRMEAGQLALRQLGSDWKDAERFGSFRLGGVGAETTDPTLVGVLVATYREIEQKAAPLLFRL